MDKEYYISQLNEKQAQIKALKEEIEHMKGLYISENKPAVVGQEVILEDKPAIVRSLYVDYKNEVKVQHISRKKLSGEWAKTEMWAFGVMKDLDGNIIQTT